jgi:tyrosinase
MHALSNQQEAAMMDRRKFVAGTVTALTAPYILTRKASAQTPRLRRDVQSLSTSDPFFAKYAEAVQKMHQLPASDPRNWRNQALIHINHCPHGVQDFVHWHRHYILNFEAICGQLIGDPNFSLAYWNWSGNQGRIPDPFYDSNLLNVQFWNDPSNAQSDNWSPNPITTIGTRGLAKGQGMQDDPDAGTGFTQASIDAIKQQSIFQFFTGQLENPHNNGHVITGQPSGHMLSGMSPLDPIFWLHHGNVDRIWAEWQRAGNTTPPLNLNYNNQFANGTGQPVMASSASALDFAAMGYNYDTLNESLISQMSQQFGLEAVQNQTLLQAKDVATAPQVLGATGTPPQTVTAGVESRFIVDAKALVPNLFRSRTYWAHNIPGVPRLAVENSRILARLSQVSPPQKQASLLAKVFVNCPYLSPKTRSTDQHYAGTFSFFGLHGSSHGHAEIVVDVTRPLRTLAGDGRIATEKVNVQVMAVPAGSSAAPDATFTVGKVELISV